MDTLVSELSGVMTKSETCAMKIYGEILKRRRRERGITLDEFTGRTGVSRKVLEGAERGMLDLSPAQKKRIKKFLRRQKII